MSRRAIAMGLAAAAALAPASAMAADPVGLWATGSEGGRVEIYRCGARLVSYGWPCAGLDAVP